jgi:folate-binding protein YgfZ
MLLLHDFHKDLGARFGLVNETEVIAHYGDVLAEHTALRQGAGVIDLSFRGRLCLTGNDRVQFLHGQVTNDVKGLATAGGCYAALVNAKGKMQSDLYIYKLGDELLLDFEPGLSEKVSQRLEQYVVADDVQVVDVAGLYGLLSVQGPEAENVVRDLGIFKMLPPQPFGSVKAEDPAAGEIYLMNQPRLGTRGYDFFIPGASLETTANKLLLAAKAVGGRACGWEALETARIEAGIPRFGADMDESNLPPECGIEQRAVSFTKGCYLGQEIINRVHTQGHVNKELHGFRLEGNLDPLPVRGEKLLLDGKEVGHLTSVVFSPTFKGVVALGYIRRVNNKPGTELVVRTLSGEGKARVTALPL